jgi:hypothetical protein
MMMEPAERESLYRFRDSVASEFKQGSIEMLRGLKWVAMPFELGPLIDYELAENMCRIFTPKKDTIGDHLYALDIDSENIQQQREVMTLALEPRALAHWSVEYNWSDWLITTRTRDCGLVCYGIYNFDVVIGTRQFVESLLQSSLEDSIDKFIRFNNEYDYESDKVMHNKVISMARSLLKSS